PITQLIVVGVLLGGYLMAMASVRAYEGMHGFAGTTGPRDSTATAGRPAAPDPARAATGGPPAGVPRPGPWTGAPHRVSRRGGDG
ncbi:hypothetical protein, partial [Micromonospora globbae]|uniref:hypothetical protein n=1 Tax=Micromonospora globbae TaxID=1894969 RepID=UPI00342EFD7E